MENLTAFLEVLNTPAMLAAVAFLWRIGNEIAAIKAFLKTHNARLNNLERKVFNVMAQEKVS